MSELARSLEPRIEAAFADRSLLRDAAYAGAVEEAIDALDRGELRVASPPDAGASASDASGAAGSGAVPADELVAWTTHVWIKHAILLYFALAKMERIEVGPFEFHDRVPLKRGLDRAGVRVVPPGVVRRGAFLEPGVIVMPAYVNIGARVGAGTMVDTWATVGTCAQVGKDCHLAGGVGIGGVLEPPSASPVIIEDGVFVGSRAVVVEGVHVGREAVIGAGVVLTSSTVVIDVSGPSPVERRGSIPPRSVVIPGTRTKRFPAGEFGVPCALILGRRTASTDQKVSLNAALRDFNVPV